MIFRSGFLGLKRHFNPRNSVIILGYHALKTPDFLKKSLGIGLRDDDFARQMRYIAGRYPVLTLDQFLDGLSGRTIWPKNSVMITFDDGYRDLRDTGINVLKKLGIPATVFITTDCIGTEKSLWTNRLYYYISKSEIPSLTLSIPGPLETLFPLDTVQEKRESTLKLSGILKTLPAKDREQMLIRIAEHLDVKPDEDPHDHLPMLNWDDVRYLRDNNVTIGSHTVTHPILSRCSNTELQRELNGSKSLIETQLNMECPVLAYPNGQPEDYNQTTLDAMRSAGYRGGFTFYPGRITQQTDPMEIPRHPIFEVPLHTFALSIS